jgi:hypothetical protein
MAVILKGKLPKDNGLGGWTERLWDDPGRVFLVIEADVSRTATNLDDKKDPHDVELAVLRIEVAEGVDASIVENTIKSIQDSRKGTASLFGDSLRDPEPEDEGDPDVAPDDPDALTVDDLGWDGPDDDTPEGDNPDDA